jgi:hypothetical protein
MGSARSNWVARLGCPGGVGNEPVACRVVPTAATVGPRMRSRQRVMVPIFLRMSPPQAMVDSLMLEPSRELSQSDTSKHILLDAWR